MAHKFLKITISVITVILFSQAALAFPFDIATYPSSSTVTVNNITLTITEVKNIEKGEVVALNIAVLNNSQKVLSTGIEDFSLGGSPAMANAIHLFLLDKERGNRMVNIIPYMGTLTSVVSTPELDALQDIVNSSYHGGLILPNASKSGYVFFRKVKDIKNFQMYSIYNGDLLTLQVPAIEKAEKPVQQPKKSDSSSGK
jgi:hypothetical protein